MTKKEQLHIKKISKLLEPIFIANNWMWIKCGIPNAKEIEKSLLTLRRQCKNGNRISSGRLSVDCNVLEDNSKEYNYYLELGSYYE